VADVESGITGKGGEPIGCRDRIVFKQNGSNEMGRGGSTAARGEHRPVYGIRPYTSGRITVTVCPYPYPYMVSKEP
jgi:hypothetical protein